MWTLWRVFDRLEDGTVTLPDGTPIEPLLPLRDRKMPPLGILNPDSSNKIFPTPLEQAIFVENFAPGTLYTDTCPCHTDENVKVFELALIQAKVTYNKYG